ncbi:hypothetical protein ACIBKY_51080 [Nonomuraea sp. NPDC050394]|uniref:hypothetical protein n=1 Tax=Nonomuraea sp. NPDC050394 TaxID=3364363 RepID=UPI003789E376
MTLVRDEILADAQLIMSKLVKDYRLPQAVMGRLVTERSPEPTWSGIVMDANAEETLISHAVNMIDEAGRMRVLVIGTAYLALSRMTTWADATPAELSVLADVMWAHDL